MAADLRSLFTVLFDYLYIRDVFVLSQALCHHHLDWPHEEVALVRRRLAVPRRISLTTFLLTYESRPRCRGCGGVTHAVRPRFCRACARTDPDSPFLMVDRSYVTQTHKGYRGRKGRFILSRIRIVKRGGNHAHLFFLRDVEVLARQFDATAGAS